MKRFRLMEETWSDGASRFFVEKFVSTNPLVEKWKRKGKKFYSQKKATKFLEELETVPFVTETVEVPVVTSEVKE